MILARALIVGAFLIAFSLSISGFFERFSSGDTFWLRQYPDRQRFPDSPPALETFRTFLRARSLRRLTLARFCVSTACWRW